MPLPFKGSQKIFIHELLLGAVDKTLIDKFDCRGWICEVKEYLLRLFENQDCWMES